MKPLPDEFVLHQNYPNPFNPTTVIKYQIPNVGDANFASPTNVSLIIYDILGNEITALVNENKPPGIYEIEFDAASLPSGVYLYKLETGSFTQIKKMVLMK